MRGRRGVVGGVALLVLLLSACDGPAQYASVRVNLLFADDGSAEMAWSVPSQVDAEQMRVFGSEFASALGLPPPDMSGPAGGPATWSGLPRDRVSLDFDGLVGRVDELGLADGDVDNTVFVSACVRPSQGRAEGDGVEFAHFDSCATFASADARSSGGSRAEIVFERRQHPSLRLWVGIVASFVAGMVAAGVRRRTRSRSPARAAATVVGVAAPVACLVLAFSAAAEWAAADPFFASGLSFDEGIRRGFAWASAAALVSCVVLVVLFAVRRPPRTTESH